jgi:hypothetical protein
MRLREYWLPAIAAIQDVIWQTVNEPASTPWHEPSFVDAWSDRK